MLVLLWGCSDCVPVSTLEAGEDWETRLGIANAVTDFVAWSGRDVCVSEITVAPERGGLNVLPGPDARDHVFHGLCWIDDHTNGKQFSAAHSDIFTGAAVVPGPTKHLEDFATSCMRAGDHLPWIHRALTVCGNRNPRDEALLEYFDAPEAGLPLRLLEREDLGVIPNRVEAAVHGNLLVVSEWDGPLYLYTLPDLTPVAAPHFDEPVQLYQGIEDVVIWEPTANRRWTLDPVREVAALPQDATLFSDARGWWVTLDGATTAYDLDRGLHGDRRFEGFLDDTAFTELRAQHGGRIDRERGRLSMVIPFGEHAIVFGLEDDQAVVEHVYCDGSYEAHRIRQRVQNARWRLEIHHDREDSGWPPSSADLYRFQ